MDSRDKAMKLIEEGLVNPEDMVKMALGYMSLDDVEDMLHGNDLDYIFDNDVEDDVDELTEWADFDPDC